MVDSAMALKSFQWEVSSANSSIRFRELLCEILHHNKEFNAHLGSSNSNSDCDSAKWEIHLRQQQENNARA